MAKAKTTKAKTKAEYQRPEPIKPSCDNINTMFMNSAQTCEFFGLTPSMLYRLVHLKKIPHYKPFGSKIYFDKKELISFFHAGKVRTDKELNQEASDRLLEMEG